MSTAMERLWNGMVKENPTFVLMLGMCPTLAVTTSAINGIGMGLTTTVILALSNLMISMLRKIIPDGVRVPAFIVVVASFVTIVQFLLEAYIPSLNDSLGLYIPLIVVNCIILGRAEAYASKNPPAASLFDGIGMGLGFTIGLTSIGIIRELIGVGTIFGFQILPESYEPVSIFVMAPGAFFVLAFLTAVQNRVKMNLAKKGKDTSKIQSGCGGDCAACGKSCPSVTGALLSGSSTITKASLVKNSLSACRHIPQGTHFSSVLSLPPATAIAVKCLSPCLTALYSATRSAQQVAP